MPQSESNTYGDPPVFEWELPKVAAQVLQCQTDSICLMKVTYQ